MNEAVIKEAIEVARKFQDKCDPISPYQERDGFALQDLINLAQQVLDAPVPKEKEIKTLGYIVDPTVENIIKAKGYNEGVTDCRLLWAKRTSGLDDLLDTLLIPYMRDSELKAIIEAIRNQMGGI